MKVQGYAATNSKRELEPFSFERREPGKNDVQIRIDYCGICHSDIHTARNEWKNTIYPCVPGHEIVGTVTAKGDSVTKFNIGDHVGVGCLVGSCKECPSCKDGLENYCEKGFTLTYNSPNGDFGNPTFGGYSTGIVVHQDFVLQIPDNLDPASTAPLLCAGITTYSPLKFLNVGKGKKVAIMGLGGLGHMAIQLAASMGAEVFVLSRSAEKEKDARELGASQFLLSSNRSAMEKQMNSFDVILDTVSAKHDLSMPLSLLKREGTFVLVGASEEPLALEPFPIIFKRRKIMGSLIGGLSETQEMLNHCGKHGITSRVEVISAHQINDAYERTIASKVRYRFVIDAKTFGESRK